MCSVGYAYEGVCILFLDELGGDIGRMDAG